MKRPSLVHVTQKLVRPGSEHAHAVDVQPDAVARRDVPDSRPGRNRPQAAAVNGAVAAAGGMLCW